MIGLLRNNFYGAFGNIKLFIVFDAVLFVLMLITGNGALLTIFALITTPTLALLAVSSLVKEGSSKWSKYKLTFPVTRKDIVTSQFISHLFWTLSGTVMVVISIILTVLIHGNQYFHHSFSDAITLVLVCDIVALLMGTVSYPMLYWKGTERGEAIFIIGAISSIGITFVLNGLVTLLTGIGTVDSFETMTTTIILAISSIAFALSYFLTAAIFQTKEC